MTSVPGRIGLACLLLLAGVGCIRPLWLRYGNDREIREAELAWYFEDYKAALRLAESVIQESPRNRRALLLAAEACARLQQSELALEYFERLPNDDSPVAALAFAGKGERLMRLGRVREAEQALRAALANHPGHLEANTHLGLLLQIQGRTFESLPFIREQIRQGLFRGDELQMLSVSEILHVSDERFVAACLAAVPDDPLPRRPSPLPPQVYCQSIR